MKDRLELIKTYCSICGEEIVAWGYKSECVGKPSLCTKHAVAEGLYGEQIKKEWESYGWLK